MTPSEILSTDLAEAAQQMRDKQEPFAFATIVRTVGSTAAKPGAKALLSADGTMVHGWLGGGCTRGAVKRATLQALQDGSPQLVSVAPEDLLAEKVWQLVMKSTGHALRAMVARRVAPSTSLSNHVFQCRNWLSWAHHPSRRPYLRWRRNSIGLSRLLCRKTTTPRIKRALL